MNTVIALTSVVIKELYRRKDFYVLFVLTAVITLLMGSVSFFHDAKIVRYVKEIALLLIWISALVIVYFVGFVGWLVPPPSTYSILYSIGSDQIAVKVLSPVEPEGMDPIGFQRTKLYPARDGSFSVISSLNFV